jgi:2-methylcitrate dehydratase PrpD
MIRRDFVRQSFVAAGSAYAVGRAPLSASELVSQQVAPAKLTEHVAQFVVDTRFEDIPQDALANGKKHILDGFGLALAGSVSVMGPRMQDYLRSLGFQTGPATVIGSSLKVPPGHAALANGTWIHADDFDDAGGNGHPTVTVLPPAFAMTETRRGSGRDLMLAYQVGVEVESRVAGANSGGNNAFHGTTLYGSFGSAAACAKLLGLDATQTANALGIVSTRSGGIRANFGTMTKPLQVGSTSSAGVEAAELASRGWTAATDILEAPLGFYRSTGGQLDPGALMNRLGQPWAISAGFGIKRFPCGAIQQAVMEELMGVTTRNNLRAQDVERVEITGNPGSVVTLFRTRPTNGLEAKFSMQFAVAIILLERNATLHHFTDEVVRRPEVQDLLPRVTFAPDTEAGALGNGVRIHLRNGTVLTSRAQPHRGSAQNPMSFEEVADKVRSNASFARWPSSKTEKVIELVRTLETVPDMRELTASLTA